VIANGYLRLDHAEWIRVVETESGPKGTLFKLPWGPAGASPRL